MPKLWSETIEAHRREVRDAILDTTWELVAERGLLSVTMSQVAEHTGIGRATLYKYFPDVETILHAWHERQIDGHLAELGALRNDTGGPGERLEAVLTAYAFIARRVDHHDAALVSVLHRTHRGEHGAHARQRLHELVRDLLAEGAAAGELREDVSPGDLAIYALGALDSAGGLSSDEAVHQLVMVTLAGLRRPRRTRS